MKQYIKAIKKIDKQVFNDPMLRPFKDLEIILRGIPEDSYAVLSFAVTNQHVWSQYSRAVEKIKLLIEEISRIEYDDPIIREGMQVLEPALEAVFDSNILGVMLARYSMKQAMKSASKEFSNEVTVFLRGGPTGPGGFLTNYVFDFLVNNEIFSLVINQPIVNNFAHFLKAKTNLHRHFPMDTVVSGINLLLADKVTFENRKLQELI